MPASPIMVAGARGLVGSALVRCLRQSGHVNLLTPSRAELDLLDSRAVLAYLTRCKPAYVFVAAAKVGGILANSTYGAQFLFENLSIQNNLIHGAHLADVQQLMFLGSSCIYPRDCPQPIKEAYLLTGPLEPTNEPYAVAKIAGIKLCETYGKQYGRQYVSVMPTNLYGPHDTYDLRNSHVIPALLRKFHEAKMQGEQQVTVWGSGRARREFMHVDDLAAACVHLMDCAYAGDLVNIGTGRDVSIRELVELVRAVVGYEGAVIYDQTMPDGTPQKLLDVSRLRALGWSASIELPDGLARTYRSAFSSS